MKVTSIACTTRTTCTSSVRSLLSSFTHKTRIHIHTVLTYEYKFSIGNGALLFLTCAASFALAELWPKVELALQYDIGTVLAPFSPNIHPFPQCLCPSAECWPPDLNSSDPIRSDLLLLL